MISNRKFAFNYVATFWAIISNYIFLPLYLKLLGPEWFGILSVGAIVQSVLVLFDSGITTTLKREFAASSDNEYKNDLLYSFEKIIFGLFSFGSLLFIVSLPFFIGSWFEIDAAMIPEATKALQLFVIVIVTQVLFFFYNGGIWGQDEQEKSSILKILFSLFRNGFVVLVLLFDNSILSFILWQIAVSVVFVFIARYLLKRLIPSKKSRSVFSSIDKAVVSKNIKFAGGMFLISVLSMINYQADKIVLSSQIAIELFGFYALGFMLSQAVVSASSPIGHSVFPQMTAAVKAENKTQVKSYILEALTMITILSYSIALIIYFHAEQITLYWTGNQATATAIKSTVPLLVIGSFLQALQFIPYHLSIAYKNTKPILYLGFLNLCITIPLYIYLIGEFGMRGAGLTWMVYNIVSTPLFYYYVVGKHLGGSFLLQLLGRFFKVLLLVTSLYFVIYLIHHFIVSLDTNLVTIGAQVLLLIVGGALIFLRDRLDSVFSFLQTKF